MFMVKALIIICYIIIGVAVIIDDIRANRKRQ